MRCTQHGGDRCRPGVRCCGAGGFGFCVLTGGGSTAGPTQIFRSADPARPPRRGRGPRRTGSARVPGGASGRATARTGVVRHIRWTAFREVNLSVNINCIMR